MRADRLVAVLLLLQMHGRMTVPQLARRLETSERTIRRDLEALCMSGVPLYSQPGRNGGWDLLGGHRIDLTGLTTREAQALLLAADAGSATLGPAFAEGMMAARRKLLAAFPAGLRERAQAAAGAVIVDLTRWGPGQGDGKEPATREEGSPEHLATLSAALLAGRQIDALYEPPGRPPEPRRLHPRGLVCKRGVWYLVASAPAGLRTYRVSRVRSVTVADELVDQPVGFDLAEAWAGIQRRFSERVPDLVTVSARATPSGLGCLRGSVGRWWPLREGAVGEDGRARVEMRFPSPRVAARELAHVEGVEVVEPAAVRAELAALGRVLVERYTPLDATDDSHPLGSSRR